MQVEAINPRLVKFVWAALIFFAWSLIQGIVQGALPSVRALLEAGPGSMLGSVHTHVGLMGWMSLALIAAIYYMVPLLSGKSIVWPKLIEWIFWIFVICTVGDSVLKIIGGITAGSAFAAGVSGAALDSIVNAYAMPAGIMCTLSAVAGIMFVVQILVSLSQGSRAAG